MPTISINEESKKYLENLRRKIPMEEKVPTIKKTAELIFQFIKTREDEFVKWAKEHH
ncbi:MAG: hypothetical protein QXI58_04540 [Candidatus Micrarchaeia archaeon]